MQKQWQDPEAVINILELAVNANLEHLVIRFHAFPFQKNYGHVNVEAGRYQAEASAIINSDGTLKTLGDPHLSIEVSRPTGPDVKFDGLRRDSDGTTYLIERKFGHGPSAFNIEYDANGKVINVTDKAPSHNRVNKLADQLRAHIDAHDFLPSDVKGRVKIRWEIQTQAGADAINFILKSRFPTKLNLVGIEHVPFIGPYIKP